MTTRPTRRGLAAVLLPLIGCAPEGTGLQRAVVITPGELPAVSTSAAVLVVESEGDTRVDEDGGQDTVVVRLSEAPEPPLLISADSESNNRFVVTPGSAELTDLNWDVGVTFTLTGVNNTLSDGDELFDLTLSWEGVEDTAGGDQAAVDVMVLDDDSVPAAGFDTVEGQVDGSTLVGYPAEVAYELPIPRGCRVSYVRRDNVGNWFYVTDGEIEGEVGEALSPLVHPYGLLWVQGGQNDHDGNTSASRSLFKIRGFQTLKKDGSNNIDWDVRQSVPVTWFHDYDGVLKGYDSDGDLRALGQSTMAEDEVVYLSFSARNDNGPFSYPTDVTKETVAIVVTESEGTTRLGEDGTQDSLFIRLASEPAKPVVLEVGSGDEAQLSTSVNTLSYDGTNWSVPQEVQLTAGDDELLEGEHVAEVTVSVASSSEDGQYANAPAQQVTVHIDDNEPVSFTEFVMPDTGTYLIGETLHFDAVFDSPVTVSGSPQVVVQIGDDLVGVPLSGGSGTNTLSFSIEVEEGQLDDDGISYLEISLNGGTLDGNGSAAPLSPLAFSGGDPVRVDGIRPVLTSQGFSFGESLNLEEAHQEVSLSVSVGGAEGSTLTAHVGGASAIGTVSGEVAVLRWPGGALQSLPEGSNTAMVTMNTHSGNLAEPIAIPFLTDRTPPMVQAAAWSFGDRYDATQQTTDATLQVVLSGVEDGQLVSLTGLTEPFTAVSTANTAVIIVPEERLDALAPLSSVSLNVSVSDNAGNPAPSFTVALVIAGCGDGIEDPLEGCDDGNLEDGDGCSSSCLTELDYPCSEGEDCGSGVCDTRQQHQDTGLEGALGRCEPALVCGNGELEAGEGCDDGETLSGDGCDETCLIENGAGCETDAGCASGVCDTTSSPSPDSGQLDTGVTSPDSGMPLAGLTVRPNGVCEPSLRCGNGRIEEGEDCDDGGEDDGDGCSSSCLVEPTGCTPDHHTDEPTCDEDECEGPAVDSGQDDDPVVTPSETGLIDEIVDADGDGIVDWKEEQMGLDPYDADSDEDGLLDGEELWGLGRLLGVGPTDPSHPDSDRDGLWDGTEVGLLQPVHVDTDPSQFQKDVDPSSTTHPLDDDSDDDCVLDGQEDANRDGAVSDQEMDPNLVDSDGDGRYDGEELGLTGPQGRGTDMSVCRIRGPFEPNEVKEPKADGEGCETAPSRLGGYVVVLFAVIGIRRRRPRG